MKHNYKYTVQTTIYDASGKKARLSTRWGYFVANRELDDIPDGAFVSLLEHALAVERSKTDIKGVDE